MKLLYKIKSGDKFDNLKEVLKTHFQISDRLLLKLKTNNKILMNGIPCNIKSSVKSDDVIEVLLDLEEDNSNIVPVKMDLNIIYEDDFLLVINKPANMPVHPSLFHYEDSLSNGVKYYFDSINLHKKIRPVNRLDKDTSGIVIFAKNEYAQECLIRQMADNSFVKEYIAVCDGIFENKVGTINVPITRKDNSIIERCVSDEGFDSVTHYEVIGNTAEFSVLRIILETGRTHQIRVHLAYVGHSILGDTLYGKESSLIGRQALHCCRVCFRHPVSNEIVDLVGEVFDDMMIFGF